MDLTRKAIKPAIASLVAASLIGLGVAAAALSARADPGADDGSGSAEAQSSAPQEVPLDPAKAEQEATEARERAKAEAIESDPVALEALKAEKEAIAAQAAAEAAAAPPLTLQDVCQEGALLPEAPPGTHVDTFISKGGWGQIVGNECISVYVGQAGSDHPNDGAVFIWHTRDRANARGMFGDVEQINVPGSGALTIQGTSPTGPGGKLYLTSASGKTYTVHGQSNQVKEGKN